MTMRDEVREQQQKLKGKSFQEKLGYFWDYYKIHTIVALFAVLTIGIFIKDALSSKDNAFSALLLNSYGYEMQESFQEDFAAYAGIDTNHYNCLIDASSTYSLDSMTQIDLAFAQRLTGQVQTNDLDAFISDANVFGHYAKGMMFLDLREELSEEEYEKYEPYFYYVDAAAIKEGGEQEEEPSLNEGLSLGEEPSFREEPDIDIDHTAPSAMEEPVPVGIYLKDCSKLAQWNCYTNTGETPVFGFVCTSQKKDLARLFLTYLTESGLPH